jgi:hypothetical protein
MNRPLGEEPHEPTVKNHPGGVAGLDDLTGLDLGSLFNQFTINKTELQNNINDLLKEKKQVSLGEVLKKHPVEKGLSEVLTYLAIASQSNKHLISDDEFELVPINKRERRFVKLPQVIFTK